MEIDPKSGFCGNLIETMKTLRRLFEMLAGKEGLALAQFGALKKLKTKDGMTSTELGFSLGINTSTVTALVDRMERDGLVSRARADDDRRVVQVWLTDNGKNMAGDLPDLENYLTALALEEFTASELNLFAEWLGRLQRVMDKELAKR